MNKSEWLQYFPFGECRTQQETAINAILDAFYESDKKFFILDSPVGTGKSAIAYTVAKYMIDNKQDRLRKSAYFLTTQKLLQEQYIRDFPDISSVFSKGSYTCKNRTNGTTCEQALILEKAKGITRKDKSHLDNYKQGCLYQRKLGAFIANDLSVTNIHFFISNSKNANIIQKRNMLVIDECHNLENVVTEYASFGISKHLVENVLHSEWKFNSSIISASEFFDVLINSYRPTLQRLLATLESELDDITDPVEQLKSVKLFTDAKNKLDKISTLIENRANNEWIVTTNDAQNLVTIKPLYANYFNTYNVFNMSDKVLLMSGTILDKTTFCKNNGIPEDDVEYLYFDSPFPIENRPIYKFNIGSMGAKYVDETLPVMTRVVKQILSTHANDKGIIHTWSYKISKHIEDTIKSDRLLFHTSADRMDVLNFHLKSKKPTVLISPSFIEGVDLYGDLSRFQIICKVMYPYLGDAYVRAKMDKIPNWYEWQTIKNIIQASGRSVRSVDDHCHTYILDSDIENLVQRKKFMIPKWWYDSLISL